jgi:hypothetical protein
MSDVASAPVAAPVSSGQARMWFLDQIAPPGTYNVMLTFELRSLSPDLLRRALATVVARHDALRASFALGVDGIEQRTQAEPLFELEVLDGDASALADAASRPFDLSTGPLVRACVVRRADADDLVAVVIHHIAADSWSLEVVATELWESYFALAEDREVELPEVTTSYVDYARRQHEWLESEECRAQLEYWHARLRDAPQAVPLPARTAVEAAPARGDSVSVLLEEPAYRGLVELTLDHDATFFMTTVTLYACLLAAAADVDDVVVAIPLVNRPRLELERVVGYFTNTLPFRIDGIRGVPFSKLLERVRDHALDAYANQEVPFERIVDELAPVRDLDRIPLANVAFGTEERATSYAGRVRRLEAPAPVPVRFDLATLVVPGEHAATATFYYDASLFERAAVEEWARLYASLARQAATSPEAILT